MFTTIHNQRVTLPAQDKEQHLLTENTVLALCEYIEITQSPRRGLSLLVMVVAGDYNTPNEVHIDHGGDIGIKTYDVTANFLFRRSAPPVTACEILGPDTKFQVGELINIQFAVGYFLKGVVIYAGSINEGTSMEAEFCPYYQETSIFKTFARNKNIPFQRLATAPTYSYLPLQQTMGLPRIGDNSAATVQSRPRSGSANPRTKLINQS